MITDRQELRDAIKKYCEPKKTQTQVAEEMKVNLVYLNQFLKGKHGVGGLSFQQRANNWLAKQKETAPEPPCV